MTEAWEDIVGSLDKPDHLLVQKKTPYITHETEEKTALRRAHSLEAIFTVMPDATIAENGTVHAVVHGKQFDFWPSSDCWFVYSTQRYGHDIKRLCEQIAKHLKKDRSS